MKSLSDIRFQKLLERIGAYDIPIEYERLTAKDFRKRRRSIIEIADLRAKGRASNPDNQDSSVGSSRKNSSVGSSRMNSSVDSFQALTRKNSSSLPPSRPRSLPPSQPQSPGKSLTLTSPSDLQNASEGLEVPNDLKVPKCPKGLKLKRKKSSAVTLVMSTLNTAVNTPITTPRGSHDTSRRTSGSLKGTVKGIMFTSTLGGIVVEENIKKSPPKPELILPPLSNQIVKDHFTEYMDTCYCYYDIYKQEKQRDVSRASYAG
jgi:hypothetical protein